MSAASDPTAVLRNNLGDSADNAIRVLQQTAPPPPAEVKEYLGNLGLLNGVPFENLVADPRFLPAESIRFFYVDVNWIEALVDGALSTGVHSDRDIRFHRVMRHVISRVTDEAAGKLRLQLRGDADATTDDPPDDLVLDPRVRAGFLMRSSIVSGWPGLEIRAYAGLVEEGENEPGTAASPLLKPLRIERLAPDILIAIFEEIPQMVVLNEPKESLHFGTGNGRGIARGATDEKKKLGVLDITEMAAAKDAADSARFAIAMIDAPDKQRFKVEA